MDPYFSLIGEYSHSIDEKGRLALPGKLRDELKNSDRPEDLVLRADKKGCVILYPYEEWRKVEISIRAIAENAKRDAAIREVVAKAERVSLDKAGRVLIAPKMREVAGLKREVMVVGGMYKIEIWDGQRLEDRRALDAQLLDDVIREVEIPL